MTSKPKGNWRRSPAVRLGGSALALALLLTLLPFHKVSSAIERIPLWLSLSLLGAFLCVHLAGVVKWRLLTNLAGADLTFPQAVRCYYGGLFANNFLPSLVGGDAVRAGMAFPVSRSKAGVILGSLVDRMMDVIGLAVVAAVGVVMIPQSLDRQSRGIFEAVCAVLLLAGAIGAACFYLLPVRRFPFKIRRIIVKIRGGLRALHGNPGRVLLCLCLGLLLQGCQVAINFWLGIASGLNLEFGVWLFAWPLAKLSALLPLTQGGIGVREAALVGLLVPFGAPPALTAAAGLIFEAITVVGGLIAGVISFLAGHLIKSAPKPLR